MPADHYVNALVAIDPFDAATGTPEVFPGLFFLTYVPSRYPSLNDRYERERLDRPR